MLRGVCVRVLHESPYRNVGDVTVCVVNVVEEPVAGREEAEDTCGRDCRLVRDVREIKHRDQAQRIIALRDTVGR